MVTKTSSQLSSLAQTLETFIKAQTSSKDPQGKNGGGTSSPPASPALNENIIRSSNGVKTRILEETAPNQWATLHEQNLAITNNSEETTEVFSNISGGAKFNMNQRIEELGFNPFIPPQKETKEDPLTPMFAMEEITALVPVKEQKEFKKKIVAADLEALILPDGINKVYMASWYNGERHNTFDISQIGYNTKTMLSLFWQDLINNNQGRTCYFHNFGGYDAILSLPSLLGLPFEFYPIMKDGEIISIKVVKGERTLLTIKDSIRILPGTSFCTSPHKITISMFIIFAMSY